MTLFDVLNIIHNSMNKEQYKTYLRQRLLEGSYNRKETQDGRPFTPKDDANYIKHIDAVREKLNIPIHERLPNTTESEHRYELKIRAKKTGTVSKKNLPTTVTGLAELIYRYEKQPSGF
jgi:hypothetical protein